MIVSNIGYFIMVIIKLHSTAHMQMSTEAFGVKHMYVYHKTRVSAR